MILSPLSKIGHHHKVTNIIVTLSIVEVQKYFYEGCQCGLDGNCNKSPFHNSVPICNCDTVFQKSVDEGYLTRKEALPVMKLSYGGAYTQHSSIQYILGPLICEGQSH